MSTSNLRILAWNVELQILGMHQAILYVSHLCGPALGPSNSAVFTKFSVTHFQFTEDNGGADTGSGLTLGHQYQHLAPCVYHCALCHLILRSKTFTNNKVHNFSRLKTSL